MASVTAVLLAALSSAVLASPRGVPRSLELSYVGPTFKCLESGDVLPSSAVNDNYCDCSDGSDEPGTSACANGRFYCINKGSRGKFISSSVVSDGVCDCCDGSDEEGRTACKNTCDAEGADWRRAQADRIRKAEEGARLRATYAEAGAKAAETRAAAIAAATAAIESATAARDNAQAAVTAAEDEEAAETARRRAAAEAAEAASGGPDARVTAALGLDALDAAALRSLLIEHARDTSTGEALATTLRTRAAAAATAAGAAAPADDAIRWLEDADAPSVPEVKTPAGATARAALTEAASLLSKHQSALDSAREDEKIDFGPDGAFFPLKGRCLELRTPQYTYSVCPFGAARQDSTSLGTFSGWGSSSSSNATDYSTMRFTGGQACWNGPARSLTLTLECGAEDAVFDALEPEKCAYAARLVTPAACDGRAAQVLRLELDPDGNDEL